MQQSTKIGINSELWNVRFKTFPSVYQLLILLSCSPDLHTHCAWQGQSVPS